MACTTLRSLGADSYLTAITVVFLYYHICYAHSEEILSFTCRGRCGQDATTQIMPCSCSELCLVYDTCCENMTKDCPNIITEGQRRFGPYIGAKTICGINGLFKIASCPNEVNHGVTHVDMEMEIFKGVKENDEELSPDVLEQVVVNTPVTDLNSGFTFLNRAIYDCYQGLSLTSQPLHWSVNFRYDVSSISQLGNFTYVFPLSPYRPMFEYKNLLASHACTPDVISSCPDTSSLSDDHHTSPVPDNTARRCEEFAGLVETTRPNMEGSGKIYRNRFCAYCHEGPQVELALSFVEPFKLVQSPLSLSVLASLTEDGTVQLESSGALIGPWSSAVCPNLDAILLSERMGVTNNRISVSGTVEAGNQVISSCRVKDCFEGFTLHPDGRCKGKYYGKIAFSDDPDLHPILSQSALRKVASFLICNLDLLLRMEPIEYAELTIVDVSVSQELNSGKILYVVLFTFSSSETLGNNLFAFRDRDILPNLHKLAVAVKLLQTYRRLYDLCPSHIITPEFNITSMQEDAYEELTLFKSTFRDEMVKFRGPIIDLNTTTTFCGSKFFISPNPYVLDLRCFDDVVYMNDDKDVADLLDSSCVRDMDMNEIWRRQVKNDANDPKTSGLSMKDFKIVSLWNAVLLLCIRSY